MSNVLYLQVSEMIDLKATKAIQGGIGSPLAAAFIARFQ